MKCTSVMAGRMVRRWGPGYWAAIVIVSLLLCGAGTFDSAAAPAMPAEDDRAAAPAAAAPTVDAAAPDAPQAPAAPDDSVEPGLWGWWKLEEIITTTESPTTPDSSTLGHEGWLGSDGGDESPALSTSRAPSYMANSGSFLFDGANDWLTMKADLVTATDANFTLAAWVYWTAGKSAIFFQGQTEPNEGLYFGIDVDNTSYPNRGTLKCGFWSNDLEYAPGDTSLDSTWHHVACVADHTNGHARRLYLDGVLVASDSPSSWYVGEGHLWMGRKLPDSAPWYFGGYIDEARAYTRALTAAEVKGLAARSDAANVCFAKPVSSGGNSNGTIYASTDWTAVQAAIDTLGAGGGTVRIAGTCTGVRPAGGSETQLAWVPILDAGATLTLEGGWNSAFTDNEWADGDLTDYPTTLDAQDQGHVVRSVGTTGSLSLRHLTLKQGLAYGAVGGAVDTSTSTTMEHVTITDSHADWGGGGIYAVGGLSMTDSRVSSNTSARSAGGVYAGSSVSLTRCELSNNSAGDSTVGGDGGGIYVASTGSFTIAESTLSGNAAGGGSQASGAGGGIYTASTGSSSTSGSTIVDNSSDDDGGGIYQANGTLSLTSDTTVRGNTAGGDGGAIYVAGGALTVSGGRIGYEITNWGNTATGNGGGIYQAGGTVALNSRALVMGNAAANGAGLYVQGGILTVNYAGIGDTSIGAANVASANGGGIYIAASGTLGMPTADAAITGNEAAQGAGVYVGGGTMTTTGARITSNEATTAGGGVYIANGLVTLGSTSTSSNQAPLGAGISVAAGTLGVSGGSIADNHGATSGGGLYVTGGNVSLTVLCNGFGQPGVPGGRAGHNGR